MAEIFISYKSERRSAARHLAKVLTAYGYDVWYDYGLVPGDDFEPRILAEISQARVVVVLWCQMAASSAWVQKEAREARRMNKFLPCCIEVCTLADEFAGADTIDLSAWDAAPRSHMIDRLLDEISRRIGREAMARLSTMREVEEDWRSYGAPSLARFALGEGLEPDAVAAAREVDMLGPAPAGVGPTFEAQWAEARTGDVKAITHVAWGLLHGAQGVKDEARAARLYRVAADKGGARAQANLAVLYQHGQAGLARDEQEAARLYKLAADQGDALGQVGLAWLLECGHGVSRDQGEAFRLYGLAADQGDAHAQHRLSQSTKDPVESMRLLRLAAAQNHPRALFDLGWAYFHGLKGLRKDKQEAFGFYRIAASFESAEAKNELQRHGKTW